MPAVSAAAIGVLATIVFVAAALLVAVRVLSALESDEQEVDPDD